MRAIRRFIVALISLLFAAAPAAALVIAPALDGSGREHWTRFDGTILEFDDHDWAIFIADDASEFLLPPLDAVDMDSGADGLEVLFSQVWERP